MYKIALAIFLALSVPVMAGATSYAIIEPGGTSADGSRGTQFAYNTIRTVGLTDCVSSSVCVGAYPNDNLYKRGFDNVTYPLVPYTATNMETTAIASVVPVAFTEAAATATVTLLAGHGITDLSTIAVAGVVPSDYNGTDINVLTADATTITYIVGGSPADATTMGVITYPTLTAVNDLWLFESSDFTEEIVGTKDMELESAGSLDGLTVVTSTGLPVGYFPNTNARYGLDFRASHDRLNYSSASTYGTNGGWAIYASVCIETVTDTTSDIGAIFSVGTTLLGVDLDGDVVWKLNALDALVTTDQPIAFSTICDSNTGVGFYHILVVTLPGAQTIYINGELAVADTDAGGGAEAASGSAFIGGINGLDWGDLVGVVHNLGIINDVANLDANAAKSLFLCGRLGDKDPTIVDYVYSGSSPPVAGTYPCAE